MKKRACHLGFTLLELMISVTILSVVSGSIFLLFRESQLRYKAEQDYAAAVQNASIALDVITRYLRQVGNNPHSLNFTPLSYSGSTLTILSDLTGSNAAANPLDSTGDPDNQLTAAYEQITVRYDGNTKQISLNVGYGESVLAENIDKLEFKFYDRTGGITADMSQVSKISITIEASSGTPDPETKAVNSITLSQNVQLRYKTHSLFE